MPSRRTAETLSNSAADTLLLEQYLPHRLAVTSKRVTNLLQRRYADSYGLSIPEWRVLAVVGRLGTLSPSAVGEWTDMDKVKVSRSAASLVSKGLVRQSQDPSDGRGRLLRLTRKGTTAYNGVIPIAHEIEATLAAGLSRTEWTALGKALAKLDAHVQKISGSGTDEE